MAIAPKPEMDGKPRSAIMTVAMHLFGKQGFNGTSMRDIANAVGLLPGSLYAHIASKEALLLKALTALTAHHRPVSGGGGAASGIIGRSGRAVAQDDCRACRGCR